jgi:gamma-glutamylcyclotransferase (GGCT)/AIG2-like uncharacterized protein YtfP
MLNHDPAASENVGVFVYGTLRPPRDETPLGESRFYPQISPYVRTVRAARLPQAVLYDLGAYPAARPGEGIVHGDLLTVGERALAVMDRIEGHPAFFRRQQEMVHTEDGAVRAWVYWGPEDLPDGKRRILSGDWFERG